MTLQLPEPPYPPDVRARGWKFQLDVERIENSDTWLLASPDEQAWLLKLWTKAWTQSPAGSLPANDELIAARIGMPAENFRAARHVLLRGWYQALDSRLYHPVITELVEAMRDSRRSDREKKAKQREKNRAPNVPGDTLGIHQGASGEAPATPSGVPPLVPEQVRERERVKKDEPTALSADRLPTCPHDALLRLFVEHLPMLPQPKPELWSGQREKNLASRWRWVLTAKKADGSRYAANADEAVAWFGRFFAYVAESDFLTGRDGRWTCCDLGWLVKTANFAKVVDGNYENREAA